MINGLPIETRNHAAFWDGKMLELTPAYDICPQPRTRGEASQGMLIHGNNRLSQLRECIAATAHFQLSRQEAVCEESQLSDVDRKIFSANQFFNP